MRNLFGLFGIICVEGARGALKLLADLLECWPSRQPPTIDRLDDDNWRDRQIGSSTDQ